MNAISIMHLREPLVLAMNATNLFVGMTKLTIEIAATHAVFIIDVPNHRWK